jgi:hypothetical protein
VCTHLEREGFHHRIDQHEGRGAAEVIRAEWTLDEKTAAGRNPPRTGQAKVGRLGGDSLAFRVRPARGGFNLEMP